MRKLLDRVVEDKTAVCQRLGLIIGATRTREGKYMEYLVIAVKLAGG
jgi:hypothetical protein